MNNVPINSTYNPFTRSMEPNKFRRPAGRPVKIVKGGRWKIRKHVRLYGPRVGRPWRAWSDGKARPYSRWFPTHAEAIDWAQKIAATFEQGDADARQAFVLEDRAKRAAEREAAAS